VDEHGMDAELADDGELLGEVAQLVADK